MPPPGSRYRRFPRSRGRLAQARASIAVHHPGRSSPIASSENSDRAKGRQRLKSAIEHPRLNPVTTESSPGAAYVVFPDLPGTSSDPMAAPKPDQEPAHHQQQNPPTNQGPYQVVKKGRCEKIIPNRPANRFSGRNTANTTARNCRISLVRWVLAEKWICPRASMSCWAMRHRRGAYAPGGR